LFCSEIRTWDLKSLLKLSKNAIAEHVRFDQLFFFWNASRKMRLNSTTGVESMDITKMLADLRQEREAIEEAILTLERLAQGRGKRRGRPPAWMTELKKRGRPPGSKNKTPNTAKSASAD
jgi:hypothetical protein